ncbi:MAG TPA: phage tail terminator protein [Buttiauxella sp.]|jgi:hypothetical protein
MNQHRAIRQAVMVCLKSQGSGKGVVTWFDGRPGFLDVSDLPAVAVYLSDAQCTGDYLDGNNWSATLHIEVFLKATQPDGALDDQVENVVLPAMDTAGTLNGLLESIIPQGYDYQRDDQAMTWGSADVTYLLRYDM